MFALRDSFFVELVKRSLYSAPLRNKQLTKTYTPFIYNLIFKDEKIIIAHCNASNECYGVFFGSSTKKCLPFAPK